MSEPIRLTIHMDIPGQNRRERWHWSRQRREVTAWAQWFTYSQRGAGLDKAKGRRSVIIHSYRRQRFHDIANLIGGCKGLIDGLVRAGLLLDDADQFASFSYLQSVASASPTGKPCTVVTLCDMMGAQS